MLIIPGGIAFVELAAIRDPVLVVPTIGHALGLADTAGDALVFRLHDALRAGRALLILDNLEQVVAAAPSLAALRDQPAPASPSWRPAGRSCACLASKRFGCRRWRRRP